MLKYGTNCLLVVACTFAVTALSATKASAQTGGIPADLLQRLERAEKRISELETQNKKLSAEKPASVPVAVGSAPSTTVNLAAATTQAASVPAKKNWYEKLKLRGYTQFRLSEEVGKADDSAKAQSVSDRSISNNQSFLMRRARLILEGDISDRAYLYFQPDFANVVPNSTDQTHIVQIRDLYADLYFDDKKVHRIRAGQSKVPYGFENLQSSANRLPLERNDAFNSATKNERDLGAYYYYTPEWVQGVFKELSDKNLKGSGNYGMFGIGVHNGQGGSLQEQNDNMHIAARAMIPHKFANGQIIEAAVQAYQGRYAVLSSPIFPLGQGEEAVKPNNTLEAGNTRGLIDERIGGSFVMYPQPFGFQAEWTVGRGPVLNAAQTDVIGSSVNGGYAMAMYKIDDFHGTWIPYVRWNHFEGGYKSEKNAPHAEINEWEFGTEWQVDQTSELTLAYMMTDRTNTSAQSSAGKPSYGQYDGDVIRLQYQVNY